jgi:hypothetical protein
MSARRLLRSAMTPYLLLPLRCSKATSFPDRPSSRSNGVADRVGAKAEIAETAVGLLAPEPKGTTLPPWFRHFRKLPNLPMSTIAVPTSLPSNGVIESDRTQAPLAGVGRKQPGPLRPYRQLNCLLRRANQRSAL